MKNKILISLTVLLNTISFISSQENINAILHITASTESEQFTIPQKPFHKIIIIKDPSHTKLNFPTTFDYGIATSSTQTEESSGNNTWTHLYTQTVPGKETIPLPGFAARSWSEWEDDIEKLIHVGVTAYRFSIEWSRIQPTAHTFDEHAINHYVAICQKLRENNIKPMVCLHHYSDPIWFMQRGGFEKSENIQLFTNYCQTMYHALAPYVEQWIIISQPAAYALKSYKTGSQPPFAKNSGLETQVMMNLFQAHITTYDYMHDQFKKNPVGNKPQIGLSHQIVQMLPCDQNTLFGYFIGKEKFEEIVAYFADRLNNQMILQTFLTGYFPSMFPGQTLGHFPDAVGKLDFVALSYYSSLCFNWITPQPPHTTPDRQAADNFRIIDEQGLYDAIATVSQFKKPIIIAESGITPHNEEQRKLYLNAYFSAISQAVTDGYNVQGFYYWTLKNNYEWNQVNDTFHFGLYKNIVEDHTTGRLRSDYKNHEALLTQGGKHYKNIITTQKK